MEIKIRMMILTRWRVHKRLDRHGGFTRPLSFSKTFHLKESLVSHWLRLSCQLIGSYVADEASFLLWRQMQTPPNSRRIMGVPIPTTMMVRIIGEKESTGGEPTPTSIVLKETGNTCREVSLYWLIRFDWLTGHDSKAYRPAEEHGFVVERISSEAEAHIQPHRFWFRVEGSDETGRSCGRFPALRLWVRVTAWHGVL